MNESLYPFVNHTTYDIKAPSALNRLAEASVRKEKSRRTKSLCWLLGVVGLVGGAYCYPHQNLVGSLLLLYGVILLLVAISWKNFQLRSSQRQLPRGIPSPVATVWAEGAPSRNSAIKGRWRSSRNRHRMMAVMATMILAVRYPREIRSCFSAPMFCAV